MNLAFDRDLFPYKAILTRFTDSALASPFRSTVPLLDGLRQGEGGWLPDLLMSQGYPDNSRIALEFRVPPPRGRGPASHTDAMVTHEGHTLALEVKWTESRYVTVDKWRSGGHAPANRLEVLRGWLDLLEGFCSEKLRQEDFDKVVYQTIHRAASACAVSARHSPKGASEVAYLLFNRATDPGRAARTESNRADLADFHALLGSPARLSFSVFEVTFEPTAAFVALATLEKGKPETSQAVRRALALDAPPLFSNVEWRSIPVAGGVSLGK